MTQYTLYPSYVVLAYHSIFSRHTMTIPTKRWDGAIGTAGFGGYTAWDDGARDADDMIKDMVNALKPLFHTSVEFDAYTIYDIPTPDDFARPVSGNGLAIAGTNSTPGWTEAVQFTYTLFDTAFLTSKLVLLDCASLDNYDRVTPATISSNESLCVNQLTDMANAWASRAEHRPNILRSLTKTINNELRKAYDLD